MHLSVLSKVIIAAGAAIIGIFSIAGFGGGFQMMVRMQAKRAQKLKENGSGWKAWVAGENKIHFYFFNITNYDDIGKGAKASLNEVGPYIYREKFQKVDITVDKKNDEVRYRTVRTYHFDAENSEGNENDRLVLINVVFLANAAMVQSSVPEDFIREKMDSLLTSKGEKLTMTGNVRQVLFDGIPMTAYTDLFNNAVVADLGIQLPDVMRDGKFALLKNKNGTKDDWFLINRGAKQSSERGKVIKFKQKDRLDYWRGESCNSINGTDGSSYPPLITEETKLQIFSPGMCRSFSLHFHEAREYDRMETLQFVLNLDDWKSEKSNPDNWCFCTKSGGEKCDKDGVLDVGPCTDGTPILLSQPHFLGADESMVSGVDGLGPEFVKHITSIEFHPMTGIPVKSASRLQYNIELHQYADMPSFSQVKNAIIPIAWLEEISECTEGQLRAIKFVDNMGRIVRKLHYVFIALGAVMIGVGVALSSSKKTASSPVKPFRNPAAVAEIVTAPGSAVKDGKDDGAFNYS